MSTSRPRWRASRAGIVNIYEYGQQVFEFGGGRLLLRGPNGSGKSTAMELLFPFLFEGDMQPTKLDPFGKKARKMSWNLLMDGRYGHRIGYAWFELRHDDPRRQPQYASFGVCLDAHKEWDDVKPRFFYLPGPRIGIDLQLVDEEARPLNRQQLHELVSGLGGETFTQANHYQERLNQVAFGYPTLKRLGQQIRLQRTLRRPQLSDTLDEQLLNELLSDALPEIDGELLERSSHRLDHIAESRVRLETLKRNEKAVREFATTYATYARAELRERRDALRAAAEAVADAQDDYNEQERQLTAAQAQLTVADAAANAAEAELQRLRGAYATLLSSPEMKAADEIAHAREQFKTATATLERQQTQLQTAEDELARLATQRDAQARALGAALERLEAVCAELVERAEEAGVGVHAQLAPTLADGEPVAPVVEQLERAARERRQAVEEVRSHRKLAEQKQEFARKLADAREQARERRDDARQQRIEADDALAHERARLADWLAAWAAELQETALTDEQRDRLVEAAESAGAPEASRLADHVADAFATAEQLLARLELQLDARAAELAQAQQPLEQERDRLAAAVDPEPAPLPIRAPREPGRVGAPLWRLLEFADDVDEAAQAGLEGALEGAGLLDAWVTPEGTVLAAGSDDIALVPAELDGATLAERLRPVVGEVPVEAALVERILRSIALAEPGPAADGGHCSIAADGSFAFGPARGAHPKERAQFIGAAARADNRARRLAELEQELAALGEAERRLDNERTQLSGRRARLAAERQQFPVETGAQQAYAALVRVRQDEDAALRGFDAAELAAVEAERAADLALFDIEAVARPHGLDTTGNEQALQQVEEQLDRYTDSLSALREADYDRRGALALSEHAATAVADAVRRRDERAAERLLAEQALHAAEGRAAGLQALGEGAERALAERTRLEQETKAQEQKLKRVAEEQRVLTGREATARERLEHATEKVGVAEDKRRDSLAALQAYTRAELLPLALGPRGVAPAREQALAWEVDGWLSFFAALKQDVLTTRGGRDFLMNSLDNGFETLRQQVDASQLTISRDRVDGLLLVRGFTHGVEQPLAVLIESLREEVEESERRLSEEDRRLFEEFITGGLADHLHERINEAKETVERMNEEIAKVQASSGMSIDVRWQRADDGGPALRRALELLQAAPSRLTGPEQRELQEFIRERVRLARIEAEENETTLAQLGKALDYRRWHVFKLRKTSSARGVAARELTKHEHDSGSGGEKAISLHLPLLAAAASYPASGKPDALRMVMLDEAFARIDDEGRRGIMGLIAKFDLDVMLTSPDYWGCCEEVPELEIYALAPRDPERPGVVCRRFHWDGSIRHAVDERADGQDSLPLHGRLLTIAEACAQTGLAEETIEQRIADGTLAVAGGGNGGRLLAPGQLEQLLASVDAGEG